MISNQPFDSPVKPGPTVWREGATVVIRRGQPLPPICMLSGRPASRRVSCLFHWHDQPLGGSGPLSLLRHYFRYVWKARLDVPLADDLMARRKIGWVLFGMTLVLTLATIGGLIVVQAYIAGMQAGPEKTMYSEIGVPVMALGGFLLTSLAALGSYMVMPMPTLRLKPIRISAEHVWLEGAVPEYLAQIPEREST